MRMGVEVIGCPAVAPSVGWPEQAILFVVTSGATLGVVERTEAVAAGASEAWAKGSRLRQDVRLSSVCELEG